LKFSYYDGIDEAYEKRLYRSAISDGLTRALKRDFFLERLEGRSRTRSATRLPWP
jgi:hypothetical protein